MAMRLVPTFPTKKFVDPNDPTQGQTLDALMLRQKNLLAQQPQTPEKIASPWQGAALMASGLVNSIQQVQASKQETAGRDLLAQAMAQRDPVTGDITPQAQQTILKLDPDLGYKVISDAVNAARERTINEREKQETIETEKRNRNSWGPVPPEVAAARGIKDPSGFQYNVLTGDIEPIDKSAKTNIDLGGDSLDKELGKKTGEVWSGYQEGANVAGGMKREMEVLNELLKLAPQGPLVGKLQEMFPGVNSAGAAAQSIIKRLAPSMRVSGSGSTSDIEYAGMLRSLQNLGNYPEANAFIGAMITAKADIDIQRGAIVDQYTIDHDQAKAVAALNALNRQSIMTPQLRKLIEAVGPDAATQPDAGGGGGGGGGGGTPAKTKEDILKELGL